MDAKTATSKAEAAFHIGDVAPDGHLVTLVMTSARVCAIYANFKAQRDDVLDSDFCDYYGTAGRSKATGHPFNRCQ
jgi:hypothetical protein